MSVRFAKDGDAEPIVGPQLPLKGRDTVYDQEVYRQRKLDPTTEPSQRKKKPEDAKPADTAPTVADSFSATPKPAASTTKTDTAAAKPDAANANLSDDLKLPKPDNGAITAPSTAQTEVKTEGAATASATIDTAAPKVDTQGQATAATVPAAAPGAEAAAAPTATPPAAPAAEPAPAAPAVATATAPATKPDEEQVAVIETRFGKITVELNELAAPVTVANFKKLVADGFYNGTTFHRVIPDFMIQGGDPNSKNAERALHGKGSPGYTLQPEIKLKHKRGSIAMARLPNNVNPLKSSNGSQFYICIIDCPFLDNEYTVFGQVLSGMDVVDRISQQSRDARDNPLQTIDMKISLQPRPGRIAPAPAEATPVAKPAPGNLDSDSEVTKP